MAHPFFDSTKYPWWRPEAVEMHRVLAGAIPDSRDIERHYRMSGPDLPSLPLQAPVDIIWQQALDNVTAHGTLKKLCEILIAEPWHEKIRSAIQAVIDTVVGAQPTPKSVDIQKAGTSEGLVSLESSGLERIIRTDLG